MPKTGIPGSYGNSIVSVLKNLHAVLHSDRSNLQSHPQCRRVSFSSYPPQCLLSTDFSMMAILTRGFPDSSVGKESIGNAGDPGSPGSGRSAGEGIGYPLQDSWVSLVTQLVKTPPAMRETWVPSLGWKDPLEKRKATHSSILAWRIPWTG